VETNRALPIKVIGCGGPLGDDSLGWEVIRRLRVDCRVPEDVVLCAVEGGHQLLDRLEAHGTLVLVDAISPGIAPGKIHRIEWPDSRLATLRPGTTHHMGPAEALMLAATLGLLPMRVIVFGVEAQGMDSTEGLSEVVTTAIPTLVDLILKELCDARIVATPRIDQAD
jgi:hydrogenase maturation protease